MFIFDARTATPRYPGIGRYTFELARALAALTDLTLIVPARPTGPEFDLSGLSTHRITTALTPRGLAQQWALPAELRRRRARLYHSPYYLMPYAPGVPTVVTVYDLIPLQVRAGFTAAQRLVYRAAHRLAFHTAARVLTLSRAARDDFARRFGLAADRISVTPPGLAAHFAPSGPQAVGQFRAEHGLPERYLLYVGSLKPHKNLPALIRACARLPEGAPPLVIAGPPDERYPEARAVAAQAPDRARFLGRVPDEQLPLLYGGATLYVQPALVEGFGFPVLEAMGCGTPVAASDIPVLRELAQDAAAYFDPRDTAAMSRTLAELLDSPRRLETLRERGLARAQAFSWARTAAQTLETYKLITGR